MIAREGAHAVIGVSSGNSYFSAQRVIDLARWGAANFAQIDLIYTDLFVGEMFEALGYPRTTPVARLSRICAGCGPR